MAVPVQVTDPDPDPLANTEREMRFEPACYFQSGLAQGISIEQGQ